MRLMRTIYYTVCFIMTVHSKSFLANRLHQINEERAIQLVDLCMKVQGCCTGRLGKQLMFPFMTELLKSIIMVKEEG